MNNIEMIHIPDSWGIKREAPTPMEFRDKILVSGSKRTYDEIFDWTTLYVEAIRVNPDQVVLVGPPLFNLKPYIKFRGASHRIIDYRKTSLTVVESKEDTLVLENENEDVIIPVKAQSTALAGKITMLTMQKNEPLIWIKDWVSYYHLEHGITSFAIFDNNSDRYTTEELREELSKLPYDITIEVIHWSMEYGPQTVKWDADFGKITMYEYFKFKYGWCCSCVINHDIDEFLLVNSVKLDDVVAQLTQQGLPGLKYWNRNMEPYIYRLGKSAREVDISERRFYDYYRYSTYNNTHNTTDGMNARKATKWLAIPQNTMFHQWGNHSVFGSPMPQMPEAGQVYYAHMYGLQSAYQDDHPFAIKRNLQQVPLEECVVDQVAKNAFEKYGNIIDW